MQATETELEVFVFWDTDGFVAGFALELEDVSPARALEIAEKTARDTGVIEPVRLECYGGHLGYTVGRDPIASALRD